MSEAYEALKKKRGRPTETAYLHTRHDLDAEIERLEKTLGSAELEDKAQRGMAAHVPKAPQIAAQIRALEEQAEADALPVTFVEIGRKAWRDLVEEHPPTAEQRAELEAELEADGEDDPTKIKRTIHRMLPWDAERFPAAAMAASCVEPEGLTVSDFEQMRDDFGEGEFNRLFNACLSANMKARDLPKSDRAFAILQNSAPKVASRRE